MTTQEPVIVIDKLEKSYGKIQAVFLGIIELFVFVTTQVD